MNENEEKEILDYEDHYLERCVLDSAIDEALEILEEEIFKHGIKPTSVEYHCPYCSFKSDFFNIVAIHIACTMSCSEKSAQNPCYPIMREKKEE